MEGCGREVEAKKRDLVQPQGVASGQRWRARRPLPQKRGFVSLASSCGVSDDEEVLEARGGQAGEQRSQQRR